MCRFCKMLFHFPFYCISEMEIDQNQYENTLYSILWRAFWDPRCNSRKFTKWKCETVLQAGESVRFVLFRYKRKTHTHVNLVTRIVLQIIKSSIHMIAQAWRCGTVYPKFGSRISRTVHPWPVSHVPPILSRVLLICRIPNQWQARVLVHCAWK